MYNPGFSPFVRCKVSSVFLRESEKKLNDEFFRWTFEKALGLPESSLLTQTPPLHLHTTHDWLPRACDAHVTGWATQSSQAVPWGVVLQHHPPESRKFKGRKGGRGAFLKHRNFFDVLKWKEVKNKECWMLECDIWKLLGKCQPNRLQALVPERQRAQADRDSAVLSVHHWDWGFIALSWQHLLPFRAVVGNGPQALSDSMLGL